VLIAIAGTLGSGVVLAIMTLIFPAFARLFLSDSRAETEVKQYADSLFLSREIFATANRSGILILVSQFERKVIILPDTGLHNILTADVLQKVISAMKPLLKKRETSQAFETGLEHLTLLLQNKVKGSGKNELPDDIIEEEGV
jgi:putative membrane protein